MPPFFQNDTLQKPDSIAVPIAADTIKPDSFSIELQPDSAPAAEKKDSIFHIQEKKSSAKTTDSLPSKNIYFAKDTFAAEIQDSPAFADSFPAIQPLGKDSFASVLPVGEPVEKILPVKLREAQNNGWAVLLFILIFSLLIWLKVAHAKRVKQLFAAFLSNRYIRQLMREEFVFSHPSSIVLTVVFLFNFSLLFAQADNYFYWNIFDGSVPLLFFKYFLALATFYLLKILLIRASAIFFVANEEITEYLFNLFLFNNILGLLLLPLTMCLFFANAIAPGKIILFSGALILFAFSVRIIKSIFTGFATTNFSKSYIILYICTLEILPLLVVIKTFGN